MRNGEIDAITEALGRAVVEVRPLAGGFSHETCLLTLTGGDRVVARLGGPDPAIEAAVMARARVHVPVPQVLSVVPAVSEGLRPAMILEYVAGTPLSEVLCAAHAPALAAIDGHARLVHADANPKNILVTRAGDGWRVDAVLDWEFSFSGCSYADAANMTRFSGDYPAHFTDGFRAGFAAHQPDGLRRASDWDYLGHVLDMFALSDLVTRPPGHPVADQAAREIRRWIADGVPGAPG